MINVLPKEDQIKVIQYAEDILDREGWVVGSLRRLRRRSDWRQTREHESETGYCYVGALREALAQLGHAGEWHPSDEAYRTVESAFGWDPEQTAEVWRSNDHYGRDVAREKALGLVEN